MTFPVMPLRHVFCIMALMLSCSAVLVFADEGARGPQSASPAKPGVAAFSELGSGVKPVSHGSSGSIRLATDGTTPGPGVPGIPPHGAIPGVAGPHLEDRLRASPVTGAPFLGCPSNGSKLVSDKEGKSVVVPCVPAVPGIFVPQSPPPTDRGIEISGGSSGAAIPGYQGLPGSDSGSLLSTPDAGVGGQPGVGVGLATKLGVPAFSRTVSSDHNYASLTPETSTGDRSIKGNGVNVVPGSSINTPVSDGTDAFPGVPGVVPVSRGGHSNVSAPGVVTSPQPTLSGSHPGAADVHNTGNGGNDVSVPPSVSPILPGAEAYPGVRGPAPLSQGGHSTVIVSSVITSPQPTVPDSKSGAAEGTPSGVSQTPIGGVSDSETTATTTTKRGQEGQVVEQGTDEPAIGTQQEEYGNQTESTEATSPTVTEGKQDAGETTDVESPSETPTAPAQSESTTHTPNSSNTKESQSTTTGTTTLPPVTANSKKPKGKGDANSSRITSVWVRVPLLIVVALATGLVC